MVSRKDANKQREKRHKRIRAKISGTSACPRLCVYRSLSNIQAQIIDDEKGVTLCSASTLGKNFEGNGGNKAAAREVGKAIAKLALEKGVENVSLYAFSTENFSRTKDEVDELMSLLKKGLKKYGNYAVNKKVRLIVSGDMSLLNADLNREIAKEVQKTAKFSGRTLNICIAYGGRQEICRAAETLRQKGEPITAEALENQLYTADLQPLDFIIRTGGEYRLSNFLLWQSAYAELYFTPVLWPDFNSEEVERALSAFSSRSRRFGKN